MNIQPKQSPIIAPVPQLAFDEQSATPPSLTVPASPRSSLTQSQLSAGALFTAQSRRVAPKVCPLPFVWKGWNRLLIKSIHTYRTASHGRPLKPVSNGRNGQLLRNAEVSDVQRQSPICMHG
jgi:hypothetical protein